MRRRRSLVPGRVVIAVAALAGLVAYLGISLPIVAVPELAASFPRAGRSGAAWVVMAYVLVFGSLLLTTGPLAEITGRKRGVRWGLGVFAFGSFVCLVAPTYGALVAGRVIEGAGAALTLPAALGVVLAVAGPERRAQVVAGVSGVVAVAAALAMALGGALTELAGWRPSFAILLLAAIGVRVAAGRAFVESRGGERVTADVPGALMFAGMLAGIALVLTEGSTEGWGTRTVVLGAAGSLVIAVLLLRRRVMPAALRAPSGLPLAVATALAGAASVAAFLASVLFLDAEWGYGPLRTGLALVLGPAAAAAIAYPLSRRPLGDPRVPLLAGGVLWVAGLLYLYFAPGEDPAFLAQWLPGVLVSGAGAGIAFAVLPWAGAQAGALVTAFAVSTGAREVGAALGITAVVVAVAGGGSDAGLVVAAVAAAGVAAASVFVRHLDEAVAAAHAATEAPVEPGRVDVSALADARGATAFLAPALWTSDREPSVEEFIAAVPAFRDLDAHRVAEIAAGVEELYVKGGEVLYEIGDSAQSLYIVRSGRLVEIGPEGELLREYATGDVIGDLAVLAETERTASGRAHRDCVLLEVPREHFDRLIDEAPGFARALARSLGRQLQASRPAELRAQPRPARVAVCTLSPGLDADGFADALAVELARARTATVVRDDARPLTEQVLRLERLERDFRRLVLAAGDLSSETARNVTQFFDLAAFQGQGLPESTGNASEEWGAFCLRQADRVLVMVDGPPPRGYSATESLRGCDLICCGELRQGELAGWWRALEPRSSHRLAPGDDGAAVAALARRLTGQAIGVVLSGGGARGFAHIGVLEELEAAGIPIDRVAGCSMGAWIGGLYALGLEPEEIDAVCYDELVRRNPLDDYVLPRHAVIRGDKIRTMFLSNLPGDVEHTTRPFFSVACDLVSGELVVHRHGRLAHAVATSMILPGLAPPVVTADGQILVDGGLRNNMPVDVLAADNEGPVIAVDVGGGHGMRAATTLGDAIPDFWVGDRAPSEHTRLLPSFGETLIRVVTLGSANASEIADQHAALVIRPKEPGVGMLDFHQLDRMREAGRRAAREALAG